ncbi:MAG: hypothetical protein JAZ02_12560, partial [Candidatus Thiodiazotropha endolucinida]|nr:hypothetical protein [Candidatus Thiodiazotropha endolucinida]
FAMKPDSINKQQSPIRVLILGILLIVTLHPHHRHISMGIAGNTAVMAPTTVVIVAVGFAIIIYAPAATIRKYKAEPSVNALVTSIDVC